MNREEAKAWLTKATAASSEPKLASDDLDLLLDTKGGGGATYSQRQLDAAAAEGWSWKADASAEYHDGGEQRIHEHCVERQKFYSRRAGGSGGGAVAKAEEPDSVKALL